MTIALPLHVPSVANLREHWRPRAARAQDQRRAVALAWRHQSPPAPPLTITLTRIGERRLDDDNLAAALKAVRDEVATCLGLDDGSPLLSWRYRQERAPRGEHWVRICVEGATGGQGET